MHSEKAAQSAGMNASSRRQFCTGAAALLLASGEMWHASAQVRGAAPATPTRPDVAAIDHDRILASAERYMKLQATPLTSLPCARSPGTAHDYYSEAEPGDAANSVDGAGSSAKAGSPPAFMAHRDAVFALGLQVPALAAAYLLTGEERFAEHAVLLLRAWFVTPTTRMTPRLDYGQCPVRSAAAAGAGHAVIENNAEVGARITVGAAAGGSSGGSFAGILETLPLVEVAQAIPFLAASESMTAADLKAVQGWFAEYLRWLTEPQDSGPRLGALARDRRDHHGSSWMLQASAYSLLTAPEDGGPKAEAASMEVLRHRFKTMTLRAQISAEGTFPRELTSATPYRDSLFNLDMMAAICLLLSTRFESMWEYQLEDGPGMRGAVAYHFPFIVDRGKWPFRADSTHFEELPGRRSSLLFSARVYQRPEYAAVWKTLPPDPPDLEILRTIPIHQPLLWVRQPLRRTG
jgi:hypothetical protein